MKLINDDNPFEKQSDPSPADVIEDIEEVEEVEPFVPGVSKTAKFTGQQWARISPLMQGPLTKLSSDHQLKLSDLNSLKPIRA